MIVGIEAQIMPKWWFRYLYIPGLLAASCITGRNIDPEKFKYWAKRGIIVKIKTGQITRPTP